MTIRGSLEEASLPDFLQLLSLGQKTGRLAVSDRSHAGYIFLESGRVVSATLANRADRLGDLLVKNGELTAQQLEEAIDIQRGDRDRKLGTILVEQGFITRAVLERFVRRQIEEAIYFLLTWQRGEIVFERDLTPESDEILVSIDPDRLLLEGARRTDEWTVIEKEIPSLDAVFTLDRERLANADLPPSDELDRIVALIDGTRNANQIIDDTGLSPFDVGKVLYDLVTSGCAQPKRRSSGESLRPEEAASPPGGVVRAPHLDFGQLERYLGQTGEFTKAATRKKVAKHIVDCAACTERLAKVHQRRTGSAPAVGRGQSPSAATTVTAAPAVTPPPAPPLEPAHHLRDAEMLRYVRREGEFQREEIRRDAGRHIADCPECAGRVRKIQRQSREMQAVTSQPSISEAPTTPALAPHPDHLTAAELGAYADRTGAFADRIRRKTAGLHIADCRECAERLKALDKQRKSTTGVRVPTTTPDAVTQPVARAAAADPPAHPPEAAPPPPRPPETAVTPAPDVPATVAPEEDATTPVPVHLNYAKLRAYAERTSEFADDEARRYARRHIMNCESCTASLRKVRRDLREAGGSSAQRAGVDRRHRQDRRRKPDRRKNRRRAEDERRTTERSRHPERRVMFRRVQTDRRVADRRSFSRRTAPELPAAAATSPRRATARIGGAEPRRPAAEGSRPTVGAAPPNAPRVPSVPAASSPQGPTPDRPAVASPAPTPTPAPPPSAASDDRPKKLADIVDEPVELPGPPVRPAPTPVQAPAPATRPTAVRTNEGKFRGARRLAAAVLVMALAGSAGWFGRSIFDVTGATDPTRDAPLGLAAANPVVTSEAVVTADSLGPSPGTGPGSGDSTPPPTEPSTTDSVPVTVASAAPPPPAVPETRAPPAERTREAPPPVRTTPPPPVRVVEPEPREPPAPPPPAPTNAFVSGVVLDPSGAPLADVHIRVADRDIDVRTTPTGNYRIDTLPPGTAVMLVELAGYGTERREITAGAGDSVLVDLMLRPEARPEAGEPDGELASGQWQTSDAAVAEVTLGTAVPRIDGLWTESIAVSTGRRPRVRVAQLTEDGARVALVISRPRPQSPIGEPRVTGLRVIPGTDAYPVTTGTASFGSLLVTAKTILPADSLRALLQRLQTGGAGSP